MKELNRHFLEGKSFISMFSFLALKAPGVRGCGHQTRICYAPINVKPQGGRPGVGGGFDVTSLPVAGTFDHSSSPGGRDF